MAVVPRSGEFTQLSEGGLALPGDGRNAAPWAQQVDSLPEGVHPFCSDKECSCWQSDGVYLIAQGVDLGPVQLSVETAETAHARFGDAYAYLLTAAERRAVDRLPAEQQHALVTRLWVRKDAALRLLGHGLAGYPHRMHANFRGAQGVVRVSDPEDAQLQYVIHLNDFATPTGQFVSVATWHAPRVCHAWLINAAGLPRPPSKTGALPHCPLSAMQRSAPSRPPKAGTRPLCPLGAMWGSAPCDRRSLLDDHVNRANVTIF